MQKSVIEESNLSWPTPSGRIVGMFTDLSLYAVALALAAEQEFVSIHALQEQIGPRLRKMLLVKQQSERTITDLVRELTIFQWLKPSGRGQSGSHFAYYSITKEGQEALRLAHFQESAFLRLLAVKMHEAYTIPGWFIARLWKINPHGGEVIIPAPLPDWRPISKSWNDFKWDTLLIKQTQRALESAKQANECAFPISEQDWQEAVQRAWERISNLSPHEPKAESYRPRPRLAIAMREASVSLLFSNIPYGLKNSDFPGSRLPVHPRTYMGWCPRLEALELLFYTDWHPKINGRLLFPTSLFRKSATQGKFEALSAIQHPDGSTLCLYQPEWETIRTSFLETLISVHGLIARRGGLLHVSLLDTRDEVCRQLRISSLCFNRFLEKTLQELPSLDYPWSIGIATDVREELSSGTGLLRHPVYVHRVPHTLLGLANLIQK